LQSVVPASSVNFSVVNLKYSVCAFYFLLLTSFNKLAKAANPIGCQLMLTDPCVVQLVVSKLIKAKA